MRKVSSVLLAMVAVSAFSSTSEAQTAAEREEIASNFQAGLRADGCNRCVVRVSGVRNTTVEIIDPEATTTSNDYRGRPVFWYDLGFRTVVYCSRPGVVYARHSLDVVMASTKVAPRASVSSKPKLTGVPLTADFTCTGRPERALLRVTSSEILVEIYHSGPAPRPEVLRYSATVRDPRSVTLKIEDLVKNEYTEAIDGYPSSTSCKGLILSDGHVDAAHIYWNRKSRSFEDWVP